LDKPERLCGQIGRRRVRAAAIDPVDGQVIGKAALTMA
jgi:hypothetical protein